MVKFVDLNQLFHRPYGTARMHRYWEIDHFVDQCLSQPSKEPHARNYEVTIVDTQGDEWSPIYGRPHHETIGAINIWSEKEECGVTYDCSQSVILTFETQNGEIKKTSVLVRIGERNIGLSNIPRKNMFRFLELNQLLPKFVWVEPGMNVNDLLSYPKVLSLLDQYNYEFDIKSEVDLNKLAVVSIAGRFAITNTAMREISKFTRWAQVFHTNEYDLENFNLYTPIDTKLQHEDLVLLPVKHAGTLGKAYMSRFLLGIQVYIKGQSAFKVAVE